MFRKIMAGQDGHKRGQQMLEHIIMITAVTIVLIYFMQPGGVFRSLMDKIMGTPEAILIDQTKSDIRF